MYFEILSNQSMRPSLLKHHLNTKHSMLVYLVRKLTEMRDTKEVISSFTDSTARAVEASLLESLRISVIYSERFGNLYVEQTVS